MLDHGMSISGHERHCVFLNTGKDSRAGEQFACVSAVSGLDFPDDGRGVSVVDWDHDGDQDLWVSNRNAPRIRYFRNDTQTGNHYITLRLIGNGVTTSRDAVGARVEVFLDPPNEQQVSKIEDPFTATRYLPIKNDSIETILWINEIILSEDNTYRSGISVSIQPMAALWYW